MKSRIPLDVHSQVPGLAIEDNASAIALGDEAVLVLFEVANRTSEDVFGACVQAVGYGEGGLIVALDEAPGLAFFPRQAQAFRLMLRPLDGVVTSVCLFTSVKRTRLQNHA